jgi:hypothetical protein
MPSYTGPTIVQEEDLNVTSFRRTPAAFSTRAASAVAFHLYKRVTKTAAGTSRPTSNSPRIITLVGDLPRPSMPWKRFRRLDDSHSRVLFRSLDILLKVGISSFTVYVYVFLVARTVTASECNAGEQ